MGCGSALGDLFILADTLVQSQVATSPSRSPVQRADVEGLRARLYRMHGEGEIDEQVFSALRDLADQGKLRRADLAVHRARARQKPPQHKQREMRNALRGIRSRMSQLSAARSHSEQVLADLQIRIDEVEEREASKAAAARQALGEGDEASARLRLMEKGELSASRERLRAQARALRDDLALLDDLHSQLDAKEVELRAVSARGNTADLASAMNDREVGT